MSQTPDDPTEHPLAGGNVATAVVRIGNTVRKPATPATPAVEALLTHLAATGFPHAPRTLGRDAAGRHVLEFLPGTTITHPAALTLDDLRAIARILRDLHHATSTFRPPPSAQWQVAIPSPTPATLICHNDLGPWNLVRSPRGDWAIIDWDGAGPSTRPWDLAYAAQGIVHLAAGNDPATDARRLRAFIDAYNPSPADRARLPDLLTQRTAASSNLLAHGARYRIEPWSTIHRTGGGAYWQAAAAYVRQHQPTWAAALLS